MFLKFSSLRNPDILEQKNNNNLRLSQIKKPRHHVLTAKGKKYFSKAYNDYRFIDIKETCYKQVAMLCYTQVYESHVKADQGCTCQWARGGQLLLWAGNFSNLASLAGRKEFWVTFCDSTSHRRTRQYFRAVIRQKLHFPGAVRIKIIINLVKILSK